MPESLAERQKMNSFDNKLMIIYFKVQVPASQKALRHFLDSEYKP